MSDRVSEEGDAMSTDVWAAVFLIAAPVWFNVAFAMLASRFDYPAVLREPAGAILERFRAGGDGLVWLWWAFAASALLLVPAVVLLSATATDGGPLVAVATVTGVLAALVQLLGLLRWSYLVPWLARAHAGASTPQERASFEVTFEAFHRFLGVGVGEHLGYLFTGLWTAAIGIAIALDGLVASWLGWIGLPVGLGLMFGSTEFLGSSWEGGWKLAGDAVPILYVAWSLWLVALGIALVL
ncbi:MAG TPA: DUF4386 domain-containing protein [Actinomycetota bacterium]|nr:DUF4386 domain-containing protein [Actinomycetota bacterium]